ncbi:MAG TPA: AI-2E family transporter [Alphaproteobacteria bacterium]|nr:AI-2E family transporter [Alphaproteobacteria bacterium]
MSSGRHWRFWGACLVAAGVVLYLLSGVLLPFVAGMAVAYILDPVADRLERWGCSRTLATSLLTAAFFLGLILAFFCLVPILQSQTAGFAKRLPHYLDLLRDNVTGWVQSIEMRINPADAERLRAAAGDFAGKVVTWLGALLGGLWSGGLALVNLVSLIVITPIVAFYLLRDWDRLVSRMDSWLPREHAPVIRLLMREINDTLAGFARGQALVCLFLGTFYAAGLSIVGLDFGLIVGIVAGFLSFIPFVGTIGGFVVSVGLAFLQFSDWKWIAATAGVFITGHLIEANLLTPKLVGERVGLHPVWIIFALLAGGALLGFVGVLLAVPVAAAAGVLARFALKRYLASPLYSGGSESGGGGAAA